MVKLSRWIREQRSRRNVTQSALAASALQKRPACALTQGRISDYERGTSVPDPLKFLAICEALELPPEAVAEGRALRESAEIEHLSSDSGPLEDRPTELDPTPCG